MRGSSIDITYWIDDTTTYRSQVLTEKQADECSLDEEAGGKHFQWTLYWYMMVLMYILARKLMKIIPVDDGKTTNEMNSLQSYEWLSKNGVNELCQHSIYYYLLYKVWQNEFGSVGSAD